MGPSINWHRTEQTRVAEVASTSSVNWQRQPTASKRKVINRLTKTVVGTLDKVVEEMEELAEAHNDDDPALVLTEVADVIGALMCYVGEHYPKTNFDALVRRAKAKNAAKGNKK